MPATTRARRAAVWLLALAWVVAALGWWIWRGLPQPVQAGSGERVDCLSYAPFRRAGESPFEPGSRVGRKRIEEDLRLLSHRTGCVRTYSVDQGLDAVPEVARGLGMRVMLGVWLGRDRAANEREIARAIELARVDRGVIKALVVGNEVLLRRELPADELRSAIERVRAAVRVPVTYADVWEFWLAHPELVAAVDFVTIHILPYWEDRPVGIERAVRHVLDTFAIVQAELGADRLFLGETGWPSGGRARGPAVPGRVEQARFVREFVPAAARERLPYNLVEAFDQPWKRRLEGAMGGHWGIFDSDGERKFPLRGPVAADPHWVDGIKWALGGSLGFVLLAAGASRRGTPLLLHALAGAATGAIAAAQWRYMQVWNRDATEWFATLPFAFATLAFAWLGTDALGRWLARAATPRLPGLQRALVALARHPAQRAAAPMLGLLRFALLFGAATVALLLVFDPRYRGFPWPFYVTPAALLVLLAVAGARPDPQAREERLLSAIAVAATVFMVWNEGLENLQALAYGALIVALAVAAGPLQRWCAIRPAPGRHKARAPISTPTADGSNE